MSQAINNIHDNNRLLCEECVAKINTGKLPEPRVTSHRNSKRVTVWTKEGSRTKIASPEINLPYIKRDNRGDLVCTWCGLILDDPYNVYRSSENHQMPDNSDLCEDDTNHYESEEREPEAGQKPTIHRGMYPVMQHCTKTGQSFFARELVRTDPVTKKREYLCMICSGKGKRAWHYWPVGKSLGYKEQATLTAISVTSEERRAIGLNPPSITDVHDFANGHFVIEKMSYSTIRDIIKSYERRGWIGTIDDPITGSRRVIGGQQEGELYLGVSPTPIEPQPIVWNQREHGIMDSHFPGFKPPIRFEPYVATTKPDKPWRCLKAQIIETKKKIFPNDPAKWDVAY